MNGILWSSETRSIHRASVELLIYTGCVVHLEDYTKKTNIFNTWNCRRVSFFPIGQVRWNSGFNFLTSEEETKTYYPRKHFNIELIDFAFLAYPSQTPIKLCSRPDKEKNNRETCSHKHLATNNNKNMAMGL